MGFEQLDTAIIAPNTAEVTAEEVAWRGQSLEDETALAIVLADMATAEAFVQGKNMVLDWERADNNFRAAGLPKNWNNGQTPRAGLSMPVVMEVVEKLTAVVFLAFFSDPQPFLLEAIGQVVPGALRAKEKLLLWATQLSNFKEEMRKSIKNAVLYGFSAVRWGWKTSTKKEKKYEAETKVGGSTVKVKKVVKDYEIAHPTIQSLDLRKVLFDPSLRQQDPRPGRFAVLQFFTDAQGLDDLRNDPGYRNVPTREELATILARRDETATESFSANKNITWRDNQAAPEAQTQSLDPLKQPLELLEYVTSDRRIVVLQRKIVICNEPSEFGRSTLLGCAFIDVPGAMYGFGVSKLLAGEQYLQMSVINLMLDAAALQLQPAFTAAQGLQTTAQNVTVSTGKIITGPELKPIPVPDVGPAALNILQASEVRATRRVGANSADNMPTQALRTSAGVSAFNEGATDKLQYFIETFADMVFIPALEAFLDICQDNLQPADIQRILTEQDGKAYEGDILDVYNARCRVQVLSSTKLNQRRAAAQLIPLFLQLASAAPVQEALAAQGMKFDFAELLEQAMDLAGLDWDSLIVPASQQEIGRMIAMASPQTVQSQSDQQLQNQKQQDTLQQIEETALGRAGVQIISHALKSSAAEVPGAPI